MAAEGEKREAMEAEKGAVEKGGDVAATSAKEEEASAKGKGVAEAKEVAGGKRVILMEAAEGEKKGAMEAEKGEKMGAMEAEKGAWVEENGKGAAESNEEMGEVASEKGKAVEEAKEVAGVKTITLRLQSADGVERCVSAVAAELSPVLGGIIAERCADTVIPLANVATGKALDTVIEYCTKHAAEPYADPSAEASGGVNTAASENLEDWDRKLVDRLSMDDLYDVMHAASFLSIKGLLDVVFQRAADMIKGKTPDEIRATFNIDNDFTPEEEEELRQQCSWIFDAE